MSISENIKPLISNTYDQNNDFKHKRWSWIDDEWIMEVVDSSKEEVSNV
jgi:hypothetical protein